MTQDKNDEEVQEEVEDSLTEDVKEAPHFRCNFCGKDAEVVFLLITGPNVNICNECVMQSVNMVMKEINKRETKLNKVVSFENED